MWDSGKGPTPYCLYNRPSHMYQMEHSREFHAVYQTLPRFTSLAFLETHSPEFASVTFDIDLANYIHGVISEQGQGDDTVLFLSADHGIHYGNLYRKDPLRGFGLQKNPVFYMVVPKVVFPRYPGMQAALERNQERVVSQLDLHATLLHMGCLSAFGISALNDTSLCRYVQHPLNGSSLLQPLPMARSCQDAGIPVHWCNEVNWQSASKLKESTRALMEDYLWDEVKEEPNRVCQPVHVELVKSVETGETHANNTLERILFTVNSTRPVAPLFMAIIVDQQVAIMRQLTAFGGFMRCTPKYPIDPQTCICY